MNKPQTHRLRRFKISRKGELAYGDHRVKCLIQDISEKGMFVICTHDAEVGLELEVRFELEPGLDFQAKIKVSHSENGCFGAEIIEVDPHAGSNWQQFLEGRYSDRFKPETSRSQL